MSIKRSNSEIFIREVYPPILESLALDMESEISKIFHEKSKTDKRYLGSLICAGIVIFFLVVLGITFFFVFIPAIIIALCLGHVIGRRWKRIKFQKFFMTQEKKYETRLECILIYLKKLKKTKIPLDYFQGILEKAFEEFLPAIALQVTNPKLSKIIRKLTSFLRSNAVHACMLNAAALLELSILHNEYPSIIAYRLRKFFIPILHLLKQPREKENEELEVVRKILEIMSKEQTQLLILSSHITNDIIIKNFSPFVFLTVVDESNYQNCKVISDLALISDPTISNLSPTLLLRRRNSCSELFPLVPSQKKENLIASLIKSKKNFQHCAELNESCITESKFEPTSPKQIKYLSPAKFDFYSESPGIQMIKKSLPKLFSGEIGDLDRSSEESEDSAQNELDFDKADLEEEKGNNGVYDDNALEIKFSDESLQRTSQKIHPFIGCFESLLSIETEENSEKNWRQVVDKPDTKVFQKKVGDSPICMIKAFCNVKYSAKTVYTAIWDTEIRTKWDSLFHEFRLIDKQEDHEVLYYMIKTPFGITRRDWLQRRIEIHDYPEAGTIILHFISIEHPGMPPKKGIIRAETIISGYIIRPTGENTCSVMIVSQNDIKGLIPKALVNSVAPKAPVDWVNSMNKGCKLVAGY